MVLSGHSFLAPFHFVSKPVDAIIAPESTSGGRARQKEKLANVWICLIRDQNTIEYLSLEVEVSNPFQEPEAFHFTPTLGLYSSPKSRHKQILRCRSEKGCIRMYQDVSGSCQEFLF